MSIEKSFGKVFAEKYEDDSFNGVVLITNNGKVTYKKAFGIANIDEEPLKTDSIFNLASVSKQFTAMCIMILKENEELDYDDPITDYLEDLPYEDVTIRQLLNHTSGLVDYEDIIDKYWEGDEDEDFITNKDLLDIYSKEKPNLLFEPNHKYSYSNTGYAFLASIVEEISELSFEEFITKNIFEPLEMKNSFAYRRPNKCPKKIVQGFTIDDNGNYQDFTYNYIDGIIGDGNIFSSVEDLALYENALLKNLIVSKETLNEAFSPTQLDNGKISDYGFGWEIDSEDFISHTGSWEAYKTYFGKNLKINQAIIVLDNSDNEDIYDIIEKAMEKL